MRTLVVRELRDPLALASAICKTGCAEAPGPALVTLGGTSGSAVLRVRELLDGHAVRSHRVERSARALLVLLTLVVLGVAASAPAWADSAHAAPVSDGHACSHHRAQPLWQLDLRAVGDAHLPCAQ